MKETVLFIRVNKGYINLRKWEGVLRVKFHWLRFKVMKISHFLGKAFQEVKPIILLRIA